MTVRRPMDGEEPILDEVEETLTRGLRDHFRRPVRIVELHSTFLDDMFSTHPISRLHLTLASGEQLTVIFKRLQPRLDRDVRRRILIHRRLLADGRLDAPAVYASVCDEAQGQYWLFLEDVGECVLGWCDDMEAWLAAYRSLARMHAVYYGQEEKLRALGCLGEHRPAFYRFFARNAHEVLRRYAGPRRVVHFE